MANTFWNLTDIFLYPLLFFISAPFFLHKLGQAEFGIWMLVISIIVTMQIFNLGIGSAVLKNTAFYIGKNDRAGGAGVVNSAFSFSLILFALCLSMGIGGYYMVRYHNMFHIEAAFKIICARSCLVAGYLVVLKFFQQIFVNYYKGLEQFKLAAFLGSGDRLTALLINYVLLHFYGLHIFQVLLIIALVNTFFVLTGWIMQKHNMAEYTFRFQLKMPPHEATFAMLSWLQSVCIIITFQSDRYLIVSRFGLIALGYYALTATMFNHLHMGLNALLPWLSPKFTKMHVQNRYGHRPYIAARNVVASFSVLLLLCMSLFYPYLFKWILGVQTAFRIQEYVRCFIAFESFFALSIVPAYYLNAVGYERVYFYYILSFSVLAFISMLGFIHILGSPLSVVYGLMTAAASGTVILIFYMEKIIAGRSSLLSCLRQLLPPFLLCWLLFSDNGVLQAVLVAGIVALVYYGNIKGRRTEYVMLMKL